MTAHEFAARPRWSPNVEDEPPCRHCGLPADHPVHQPATGSEWPCQLPVGSHFNRDGGACLHAGCQPATSSGDTEAAAGPNGCTRSENCHLPPHRCKLCKPTSSGQAEHGIDTAAIRAAHTDRAARGSCTCGGWSNRPCDIALLLAALDRAREENARLGTERQEEAFLRIGAEAMVEKFRGQRDAARRVECPSCNADPTRCATARIKCCPECTGVLHQTFVRALRAEQQRDVAHARLDDLRDWVGLHHGEDCADEEDCGPAGPCWFAGARQILDRPAGAGDGEAGR